MKLYIVRHGEPDYRNDTVTEKGKREIALLGEYMKTKDIKAFYMSPLGRARATCEATLQAVGKEGIVLDWLQEYMEVRPGTTYPPKDRSDMKMMWDRLPSAWGFSDSAFDRERWIEDPYYEGFAVKEHYQRICNEFDALLASHGYERDGFFYKAVAPHNDAIALYCHFGLESVLLSHLFNVSPNIIWHFTGAAPSSVTLLATEEREEGTAIFRMLEYGSTAHLALGNEEPSFMGRFRECYTNDWERP